MAEEQTGEFDGADGSNVATLNALHLDGKGQPGLEDANEQELPDASEAEGDNVVGHANVQSADRTTFEGMVDGGLREGPATPAGDRVVVDQVEPTEPDNNVLANFENPHPQANDPAQTQEFAQEEGPNLETQPQDQDLRLNSPQPRPEGEAQDDEAPRTEGQQQAAQEDAPAATQETPPEPTQPPAAPEIDMVADGANPDVEDSAGMEDAYIPLHIEPNAVDSDETVTIYLTDVPDGADIRDGEQITAPVTIDGVTIPAGSWMLTVSDLDTVAVKPPANVSDDFHIGVYVVTTETNSGDQSISDLMDIRVDVGVWAPELDASGQGVEDQWTAQQGGDVENWIDVSLDGQVTHADGTESLSLYLQDIPDGVLVRNSQTGALLTPDADGKIDVTGVTDYIQVRWNDANTHSDADISFKFGALVEDVDVGDPAYETPITDTVAPDSNQSVIDVTVKVLAVADAPTLDASAVGVEDKYAVLDISSALVDADGSETLSVSISGLPAGTTLNHGALQGDGSYLLTADDLAGLRIENLPHDSDDDFQITVTATTTEAATGDQVSVKTATTTQTVTVSIFGDADQPTVTAVSDPQTISEDSWFDLRTVIGSDHAVDASVTDVTQESLQQFQIRPVDADHSRLMVNGVEVALPADGYWTVTYSDLMNGNVLVAGVGDWASLSDTLDFDVRVQTREADYQADTSSLNGAGLTRDPYSWSDWDVVKLQVNGVADTPTASASGVGVEDKYAVLNLSGALADADGSETLTFIVADLPAGATLNHGALQGDGTYLLQTSDLAGLRIENLPQDSDADFQITVKAIATDVGGDTAERVLTPTITIFGDADQPSIETEPGPYTINEDSWFNLGTSDVVQSALADQTNETLIQFRIYPVDADHSRLAISSDSSVSNGEIVAQSTDENGAKYWLVSYDDLSSGKVYIGGTANWSTWTNANSDGTLDFNLQVETRESDYQQSTSSLDGTGLTRDPYSWSDLDVVKLKVTPVADATTVGASVTGNEDSVITVAPTFTLVDTDGSEHLTGDVLFQSSDPDMLSGALKLNGVALTAVDIGGGVYQWTIPESAIVSVGGSSTKFTLSGLTFTPSEDNAGDMTYTVKVTTTDTDDGITHVTTATGCAINVTAIADQPTVAVGAADMNGVVHLVEDTRLALGLDSSLTDIVNNAIGSSYNPQDEYFSQLALKNVPSGWTVWEDNGDGTYTQISVSSSGVADLRSYAADLDKIMLLPPTNADLSGESSYSFTFIATSHERENGSTSSNSINFKVTIDAVADAPTLQVTNVRTNEDTRVALDIRPALTDTDSSESVSDVFLSGVPAGASFYSSATGGAALGTLGYFAADGAFVADAGGTVWRFAAADLDSLYLQPRADSNYDFDLSVVARSTEAANGDFADSVAQTLHVTVKGVSDGVDFPADLHDGDVLIAHGDEDTLINPNFDQYQLVDVDAAGSIHGPEVLSVVIKELPDGVTLVMANGAEKYAKYLGTVNGHEQWSIDPEHLADVRFSVPSDYSGTIEGVKIDLVTTENDGNSKIESHDLNIVVSQVADAPNAGISASVTEDGYGASGIPVTFNASIADAVVGGDRAEEISHVEVQFNFADLGLPDGTTLTLVVNGVDQTLTSGQWIDVTDSYGTQMYLKGVPEDWSKDIPVTLKATSSEYDDDGVTILDSETTTVNGKIQITAEADHPDSFVVADENSLAAGNQISGSVGDDIDLGLSLALGDHDGSEPAGVYFVVKDVPNGVELHSDSGAVVNAGNGYWIVTYEAGSGSGWHLYASSDSVTGTAELTIRAVIRDNDPDGGSDLQYEDRTLTLTIDDGSGGVGTFPEYDSGDLNPPSLTATPDQGTEDVNFALDNVSANPAATDGGAITAIVIGTQQAGVTITSSTGWDNPFTGEHVILPADLSTLVVNPPDDYAGDVSVNLTAVASDGNFTASTTVNNLVVTTLDPDTDGAGVTITADSSTEDVSGGVPFTVSFQELDNDFSEIVANGGTVTITLPSDAGLLLNGVSLSGSGGVYTLNLSDFGLSDFDANGHLTLSGLTVVPPAQYHGGLTISASISVAEPGDTLSVHGDDNSPVVVLSSGGAAISLTAVADVATIEATDVTGNEDSWIALDNITVAAPDIEGGAAYGSEYLTVKLSGMPADAVVDGALKNSDGSWTVKDANVSLVQENGAWVAKLTGVKIQPPEDASGSYELTVTTYTYEPSNKSTATASASFTLGVDGVADTPTIDPVATNNGSEDTPLLIDFNAQLIDVDGSEYLSITVTGVPTGASFVNASGDAIGDGSVAGSWTFTQSEIDGGIYFLGNPHDSGSWTMTATATSYDGATSAVSNSRSFTVTLSGVADAPVVTLTDLTSASDAYMAFGNEEGQIALGVSALTPDSVGETLEVLISGAPAGTSFVNGSTTILVTAGDGYWHIPSSLVNANLKIVPPSNYNGDVTLSIVGHTTEGGTDAYSDPQTLVVNVAAVNDAPVMTITGATGQSEVGAISSPIYVIPEGQENYIDISDQADGVANPTLTQMDISIVSGGQSGDGVSLAGLSPSLDASGNLVVDFEGHVFALSYNAGTQTLTFTGTADADTYEALAKHAILSSSDGALDPGVRTLQISVYDQDSLTDSIQTTATVGNVAQNMGVTLTDDALGTVQWSSTGAISLIGSGADDILVVSGGDSVTSMAGGDGFNTVLMQTMTHGEGDWIFSIDANGDVVADASGADNDFIVHLTSGSAEVNAQNEVEFTNASGSIEFDNGEQIAFSQIDKMAG